jgi:hypothetical protein
MLIDLQAMFDMAKGYAQSKDPEVTPKQRQIWIRIMAYLGQVINSISNSFDEAKITQDLVRLEKMLNEAMAKEEGAGSPAAS